MRIPRLERYAKSPHSDPALAPTESKAVFIDTLCGNTAGKKIGIVALVLNLFEGFSLGLKLL
ncbi:MAG: hypothetical protein IJT16_07865 [Lachnospiraceae bacterium]|nr:hypothetical protein [Lachnospiraceae bacterium]